MSGNVKRYGIAILAAAVSLVAVVLLERVLPFPPLVLFAAPVAIASRFGGRGPTIVAIMLCIVATDMVFVPPLGTLDLARPDVWIYAAIFALVGLTIDMTSESLRRARQEAEQHAEEVATMNMRLGEQIEEVRTLSEDLHETNQSLELARDAAERASRAREEVLGVVAHDLRNPLNVVLMTTRLFLECDLPEERRVQLLKVMLRAGERMNRLIEDLLDVVRLEAGHLTLDLRDVAATKILADTAELFQQAAAEKGITVRVDACAPEIVARVDADRLQQALGNLVGNALKHTGPGTQVVLRCVRQGSRIEFIVSDSGPGIPPEQLGRLFEKFWQGRRADRRGVGLGLTIARGIAESHGGSIRAESRVGAGTTFYLTLPSAQATMEHGPRPELHLALPPARSRPALAGRGLEAKGA